MVGGVDSALALPETKYIYTIILHAPETLTLQQVKCIHLNNWVSEHVEKYVGCMPEEWRYIWPR